MIQVRKAFTMIEIIFVIVILGILAAVAIPKLAATRDDAYVSKTAHSIMTTAFEISTFAIANGFADDMDKMSNVARSMQQQGHVVLASSGTASALYKNGAAITDTATYEIGKQTDCVKLTLTPASNDTELVMDISFASSSNELCSRLQKLIDSGKFPMRLRGNTVVY